MLPVPRVPVLVRLTQAYLVTVLLAGLVLRLWQYLGDASLFIDELALARDILERSGWELASMPLRLDQVAPVGFLLAEKVAVTALGSSEYALRLFPFFCSVGSLFGFWLLARRILSGLGTTVAVTLFATAGPLIAYAGQVKPYSCDVAAAVLMVCLALELRRCDASTRRACGIGVIGAASAWFSAAASLVLAALTLGLLILLTSQRSTALVRPLAPAVALWMVGGATATAAAITTVTPATRQYLRAFWTSGFMPLPFSPSTAFPWLWGHLEGLFGRGERLAGLAYPLPGFYVVLTAAGYWLLWRRKRDVAVLLLCPLAVTLAAAVAQQYPFSGRLILFFVPLLLLALAEAIASTGRWLARGSPWLAAIVTTTLVVAPVSAVVREPPIYRNEDIKPVLSFVRAMRRPGDSVYVYYGARLALDFYGPRYGLRPATYRIGGCHRRDPRRYLAELDRLRGRRRVWVIFSHYKSRERKYILGHLSALGDRSREYRSLHGPWQRLLLALGCTCMTCDTPGSRKLRPRRTPS